MTTTTTTTTRQGTLFPLTGADIVGEGWTPATVTTLDESTVRAFSLRLHTPDAVGVLAAALAGVDVPAEVGAMVAADSLHRAQRRLHPSDAARLALRLMSSLACGTAYTVPARVARWQTVRAGVAAVRRCNRATGTVASLADAADIARAAEVITAAELERVAATGQRVVAARTAARVTMSERVEHVPGVGDIPAAIDGPGSAWLAARADRLGDWFAPAAARRALAGWTSTGRDTRTGGWRTVKADRIEPTTVTTGGGTGGYRSSEVTVTVADPAARTMSTLHAVARIFGHDVPAYRSPIVGRMIDGAATAEDTAAAADAEAVTVGRTTGRTRKVHTRRQSDYEVDVREWALSVGVLDSITDAEVAELEALQGVRGGAAVRKRARVLVGAITRLEGMTGEACPATVADPIRKASRK